MFYNPTGESSMHTSSFDDQQDEALLQGHGGKGIVL